jgi:putative membrane protein
MWGYEGGHGWWWGFGALHMLLYWGVLILAIALLVKWLFGGRTSASAEPPRGKGAIEILRERYARGEIDKKEYEEKKRDLEGG